jgi:GntR family transcriptional regulator
VIKFKLNTQSGVPFYRQIIDQVRFGIATSALSIGEQLPTVRALAVELQINLHTVNKAYKELEWQNVVFTQQGTGTFITSSTINIPASERLSKLEELTTEFLTTAANFGFNIDEVIKHLQTPGSEK